MNHLTEIQLAILAYVAIAIVNNMPPKGAQWSSQTVYAWPYDVAHALANARRANPTLPVEPAQPKQ